MRKRDILWSFYIYLFYYIYLLLLTLIIIYIHFYTHMHIIIKYNIPFINSFFLLVQYSSWLDFFVNSHNFLCLSFCTDWQDCILSLIFFLDIHLAGPFTHFFLMSFFLIPHVFFCFSQEGLCSRFFSSLLQLA